MYKFTKIIIPLTVLCLFITVLNGCKNSVENSELPKYVPNVQWSLETVTFGGTSRISQYNKYLYFVETNVSAENTTYHIAKIDLETGLYVWKSSDFIGYALDNPIKCKNYVFLEKQDHNGNLANTIYCFSDFDGKLKATITFGNSDKEKYANRICNSTLYSVEDNYLIWSNGIIEKNDFSDYKFGILKIEISDIDFSKPAEYEQYIKPVVLLELDRPIYTHFVNENSIVYYTTYSEFDDLPNCKTGAVDIITGNSYWERESSYMKGNGDYGLYILNDEDNNLINRIYSFECFLGCYDKTNGDVIWEKIQTEDQIKNEVYLGGLIYNAGPFYNNGCFYYTTMESFSGTDIYRAKNVVSNIKCIDAKTGKLRWHYMPDNSASLYTRPIVANGKVFIFTYGQGLYVLDEKSGAVLGVDTSIYTKGFEKNALYNGNVIFFDFSSGYGVLKAIKP
ncbi:MAG: PQQ-like beta-propeller repeat protein [Spirochaetia bacterium]|nr:PQQ-like beta-propeller repeat protein [Spirochaetia bacterium]